MSDKRYADQILQLAVDNEVLTPDQAEEISYEHEQTGRPVRDMLVDAGYLSEDDLLEIIAGYLGTRVVNLPATDIPQDVIRNLPASVARMYNVVPVSGDDATMELAVSDMVNPQVMDELMFVLTRSVSFVLARQEDVRSCINQFYGDESDAVTDLLSAFEEEIENVSESVTLAGEEDAKALEAAAGATPVIRYCNLVLFQAIRDRASDIHFEPFEREFKIRYRVDGALYEMAPPPRGLASPLISRIKVMSNLNIAERRVPQDGRIQLTVASRPVDLRVSTLPTQFGESVVLRVLDRSMVSLEIDNLGMPDDVKDGFTRDIRRPNGIVIVTGPTGSGKTTTL
jgi:type IV pilus assembly protein PilB